MAAPRGKPAKTSAMGTPDNPYWARTNVLCNGQIGWKVGWALDMEPNPADPQRADLKPIADVVDDLNALNSLQIQRANPLTPLEIKQPLRHAHFCLPKAVKARIYTGDLYGSRGGVFSCPDDKFETTMKSVFENDVRADGQMNDNDFFRRLRRAEWFLWDVEVEKGQWIAVIAHLYKRNIRNPLKKSFPDNPLIPSVIPSPDFNRIDEWCAVTARRSPKGDAMIDRVKQRLPAILNEGRIRIDSDAEIVPAIWVPKDESTWSSGIRVYALIKTLMHRVTDLYCRQVPHQTSFWDPLPGWIIIDETRAEMQGRAAQRCLAATGYRSRIAIEGIRRYIGSKEKIRADELRPRMKENQAYETGKLDKDGDCIPIDPVKLKLKGKDSNEGSDNNDNKNDNTNNHTNKKPSKGKSARSYESDTNPEGSNMENTDDQVERYMLGGNVKGKGEGQTSVKVRSKKTAPKVKKIRTEMKVLKTTQIQKTRKPKRKREDDDDTYDPLTGEHQ